jgi:nicotinate-nucleotide pyrophosphorylase (carboxylating)
VTVEQLVRAALDEDIGPGDRTTDSVVPADLGGVGRLRAKEPLVVCGVDLFAAALTETARRRGAVVVVDAFADEGAEVAAGTVVAEARGPVAALLTGERVALNLVQWMSGVATHVRRVVTAAGPGGPRVLDTRKSPPLYRSLAQRAVRAGGATNHRAGLFDGVLIKDNHVDAAGGVAEAVRRARAGAHHLLRVQVEARTEAEAFEALRAGADALLLDNFDDAAIGGLVARLRAVAPGAFLEASGNMTAERVAGLAGSGLDAVSMGGLVHQARWVDLSLKVAPA